jgi:disulfide bond formation protein DsbB
VIELLAVLAVVAQATVVVALVCWFVQLVSSRRPFDALTDLIGRDAFKLAFFVSLVATAGSLYMSEIRNFDPCILCWYQRICMYPLTIVLGMSLLRRDRGVGWYALPLSLIGLGISIYHYQLERFPNQESISCSLDVPCTTIWFEQFGYITIPMMALSAFSLIAVLVWLGGRHGKGISREA